MIRFDKDSRILKTLDFPQSTAMLSYQLTHSADAVGRIEAAEALAHAATKQASLGEEKIRLSKLCDRRSRLIRFTACASRRPTRSLA
jgi:uncharacterized protein YhaN